MKASLIVTLVCAGFILVLVSGCSLTNKPYNGSAAQLAIDQTQSAIDEKQASDTSQLEQLSIWSDALYTAANNSKRQEAYLLLQRIEGLAATPAIRNTGTPVGWQAFDLSLQAAKKSMPQKGTTALWYTETARLKLASDAVFRPDAPLWLQYEGVLKDDAQRIRTIWESQTDNKSMAAEASIGIYSEHLDRLEVAALMQRDAGTVEAVKERIGYLKGAVQAVDSGQMRPEAVTMALDSLNAAASELFQNPNYEGEVTIAEALPPGMTVGKQRKDTMLIGEMFIAAFVMGVLGFAGWRKYRSVEGHSVPISRKKFPKMK